MYPANDSLPCHLGNLPNELLLAIVAQLEVRRGFLAASAPEEQRQRENAETVGALHALTLTCRKLNAITNSDLYRCIVITPHHNSTARLLLRTLVGKAEFSRYVQYIETHEYAGEPMDTQQQYTDSDLLNVDRCLASTVLAAPSVIRCFRFPLESRLKEPQYELWRCIRQDAEDPHEFAIAALISLSENLSEAALSHGISGPLAVLGYRQYPIEGGLNCLWLKADSSSICPLSMYKAEPTPQTNPVADVIHNMFVSRDESNAPLHVEEISLDILAINWGVISMLLPTHASLTRFTCRWIDVDSEVALRRTSREFDLSEFRHILDDFKTSLESLTIDTMDCCCLVDMDEDIPAFGSFREFTALRYIDATGLVLWGDYDNLDYARLSEILPSSLETLKIKTEWDDDVEDALHNLYGDCAAALPQLKRVECTWRPAPRVTAEYLIEAFSRVGVELVLSITDEDTDRTTEEDTDFGTTEEDTDSPL